MNLQRYIVAFVLFVALTVVNTGGASLHAQEKAEVFTIVEEMPEPEGGIRAMMEYIGKNIRYPAEAVERGIGGKVFLKFVVDENGKLTDMQVQKSSGLKCMDDEAVRVVLAYGKPWKAGKQSGRPVKTYYNLPINFSLEEPFYILNINSSSTEYKEFCQLLMDEKFAEIEKRAKKYEGGTDDYAVMYNYAVVEYYKDKKHFCKLMRMAQAKSEMDGTIRKLSSKYLSQYCN